MVAVTVTVDDDHLNKIEQVAAELRGNGMQVTGFGDRHGRGIH